MQEVKDHLYDRNIPLSCENVRYSRLGLTCADGARWEGRPQVKGASATRCGGCCSGSGGGRGSVMPRVKRAAPTSRLWSAGLFWVAAAVPVQARVGFESGGAEGFELAD